MQKGFELSELHGLKQWFISTQQSYAMTYLKSLKLISRVAVGLDPTTLSSLSCTSPEQAGLESMLEL
jgi:hypothetical protein